MKKLPPQAQKLWEATFKKAKSEGLTESKAAMAAWSTVKAKYKKDSEGKWILKGGFVTTQEVILRNFESDGDFFFEAYVTSWEPDNGDMTGANGGESVAISKEAGMQIAKDLEELKLGGGIEHDTFEGSSTYDEEADKVFTFVKAAVDERGVKTLVKLNKNSKRYAIAKEGILRGLYQGLSLEVFPATAGFTYKTTSEGKPYKELNRVARTVGATLTKNPLDNRARINKTYETRKKRTERSGTSKKGTAPKNAA